MPSQYKSVARNPKPPKPIKAPKTRIQKVREIVLVLLDVDKVDIERATGVSRGVLSNIFTDRHRSPDAEQKVATYLNSRIDKLTAEDWRILRHAGGIMPGTSTVAAITPESLGWPPPHLSVEP